MSRICSRPLHLRGGVPITALLCLLLGPGIIRAQTGADVVRGRVTDDSAHVIAGASVVVTRGPDRLVEKSTSDSSGAFSLRFDPGTGDYLVYVSAPGFASARRRVQREGNEHELVANFVLKPDLAKLAAVNVKASKPVRATNYVNAFTPETGSSEKWEEGVEGQIPLRSMAWECPPARFRVPRIPASG
jgi:hypothetical protein